MVRYIANTLFFVIVLLAILGVACCVFEASVRNETRRFDAEKFKQIGFSDDELSLFCDVAFTGDEIRVRKWTDNIFVEIKNIDEIEPYAVEEVDSIIAILAPLIAPVKIQRVESGGNLHVYRRVERIDPLKPEKYCPRGLARINKTSAYSWDINFAIIFDGCDASSQTLMHEFEHALGLNHPIKLYPYYITIGRSVIPQYFRTMREVQAFRSQPFYLSPQEKTVIRMLYSPEVRPGMHIDHFAARMEMSEDEKEKMIPQIRIPRIIIYPSPDDYFENEKTGKPKARQPKHL
ncbi:hypothetical protein [Dysgonomonas sp. 511]|uniref:hypothetical protein n=1 Tax=Dysgonomonas sp. 511 TaxID=2302930 RepID=UPI0013D1A795|nr:hypothetical protein [Dysgonomonas sp. 511]